MKIKNRGIDLKYNTFLKDFVILNADESKRPTPMSRLEWSKVNDLNRNDKERHLRNHSRNSMKRDLVGL